MAWLRLEDSAPDHPKILRVARALDVPPVTAFGHVATLWCWVNRVSPDGDVTRFEPIDIAIAANWGGCENAFFDSLVSSGLIDEPNEEGEVLLHDWMEYAESHNRARKEKERRAKKKQALTSKRGARVGHGGARNATRGHESSRVPLTRPDTTRHDQTRHDETDRTDETGQDQNTPSLSKNESGDILSVFSKYREYHQRAHKSPSSKSKEWKLIKARLSEGYTVEDLGVAVDGCHASPWHQGENPGNKKYDSLELIMRDGSKVSQFIELWENRNQIIMTEKEKRGERAGEQYMEMRKALYADKGNDNE